jgi:PfaB family protein
MTEKLAIVGMDAFFGTCYGLDNFQRTIYEATQHFISVPPTRYQDIQQKQNGESPLGSYIKDFEIDAFHFKIPPHDLDKYDPRQLLMLKVIDNALRDASLDQKTKTLQKVAVVTVIKDNPVQADNSETEQKNIIFSKISALWNISGPNFSVCVEENSVFEALEIAKMLLVVGSADTVVVGAVNFTRDSALWLDASANINTGKPTLSYDCNASGTMVGEGAGAVVLKRYERAKQDSDRIYAVIDAVVLTHLGSATPTESAIQSCHKAFEQAEVKATDIGYLEVFASGDEQQDNAEIESLIQAYQISDPDFNCAIGSVKTNIGHTYLASGIASLIKTALCLYNRYIPATPQWSSPKRPEWQNSPFYVATESIPWFLTKGQTKRTAAINSQANNGTYAHLVLSEDLNQQERSNRSKEQTPFYLFPIAGNDQSALLEQLDALEQTIENSSSLSTAASQTFAAFQRYSQLTYALAIVGHDKDELLREIQRGRKGIPNAFAQGKEWKSPKGSYFTPKPLGKHGIAFVYPGAFNSYLGMGRKLFYLFPKIYERAASFVSDPSRFFRDKQLYPRSLNQLSKRQQEELEAKFLNDSLGVQVSGTGFAVLLTFILRDYFRVQPQAAFGYSMGEGTMLYALNVWTSGEDVSNFVHSSPMFKTRLLGAKNVLCDYWDLGHQESEALWHSYVLMATPSAVMSCLEQESQVYLTNINTPAEVVIGGEPQACLRVIKALNCEAFRAPVDLVLHCEPMASEYDQFCKLNTSPFQNVPEINFYSSANYDLITLDKEEVTHTVSQGFCQRVDFPRLVNRVYEDGAKIFIDLGPGSTCSRWIAENLGSQEHVSISLNRRGVDDYVAIVRALGQLLSHRVSVDLSPLYSEIPESTNTKKTLVKTVTLDQFPLILTTDKKSLNIVLDEADVLEFADGKVSHVFGKEFESIDSHARRVRLPSLPYLFVSRVNKLEGNRNEYDSGFIQTEYDVPQDAWYSVDGQIPVGIYEEASQGLLALLGYLGTDFESKGERSFRLLDFTATFCCEQPKEIKTLLYNVKINSYVRTTYNLLVFFSAECFIGEKLFLKISGGCAGLFSDQELEQGQGIIVSQREEKERSRIQKKHFQPLLSCQKSAFNKQDLLYLSQGNIAACFGDNYKQNGLNPSLRLPSKMLMMLDRVISVDSQGGAAGIGLVIGEKSVEPDDWYFLCHFKNDPTLPGSLMVEGSAQLLQFYILFLGLQSCTVNARFQAIPQRPPQELQAGEPVQRTGSQIVRFRGQVTPTSGTLIYKLEVTEIGLSPKPFVIGNVDIIFGNKTIAYVKNLSWQLSEKNEDLPIF